MGVTRDAGVEAGVTWPGRGRQRQSMKQGREETCKNEGVGCA